jgi:hypothetical protein
LAAVCSHIWTTRGRGELTAGSFSSSSFLTALTSESSMSLSGESLDGLNARQRKAEGFFK